MFTASKIRELITSAADCETEEQYLAEEGGALPDDAPYDDGTAESLLRMLYRCKDGIDPTEVRQLSGMGRAEFSRQYGINIRTIENWESEEGSTNYRKAPDHVMYLLLADVLNRKYHE